MVWKVSSKTCYIPTRSEELCIEKIRSIDLLFYDLPEGNKEKDNGDDEDNNKSQPGEEGDTEVENILDTLQHMGQKSKVALQN